MEKQEPFKPYVNGKGDIVLPAEFCTWEHLGTRVLTPSQTAGPGLGPSSPQTGIHVVYTQPESAKHDRQYGKWPDGATIVMVVRAIRWNDLPTGHVIEEGEPLEWFVMIRDSVGRFIGSPHWGNGWGRALFKAAEPGKNASADYKTIA